MDRNSVIGFSLLAVLVAIYLFYNQYEQKQFVKFVEQRKQDSLAYIKAHPKPSIDTTTYFKGDIANHALNDSLQQIAHAGLPISYFGKADTVLFENKKLSLKFSTKGAFPFQACIKDYVTYFKKPLMLFNGDGNKFNAILPYDNGKSTEDLYFVPTIKEEPNGDKTLDFRAELKDGKKVDIVYTLPVNDYMLRCSIILTGLSSNYPLYLNWQNNLLNTEKDISVERTNTQFHFRQKNEEHDYFTVANTEKSNKSENGVTWIGTRKQYFSNVLICEDGFNKTDSKYYFKTEDSTVVAHQISKIECNLKPGQEQVIAMKWYIGPNDFKTLEHYKLGLEEMVPLGYGLFAFVKYVNRFALIPFFYFLAQYISSFPLIILIMTITLRLVTSFFTYKSYLSSAKMRVMKPELDELRAKCGEDQQKFSMESMKLYKSAGVNPMGGCIPSLIQMPILLSIFYLIPPLIEFRQKNFLWCNDLSCYDSILDFHFMLPWYGDHISLFTLLMTLTSLLLALYNRNMTPKDPNNPALQYMPYIFPIFLMGIFNKSAAALTFYYTISNMLSLLQQIIIQKYFIDEKAIHAQLQQNKSKPVETSKWAQKLEEIQKLQAEKTKVQPKINKK